MKMLVDVLRCDERYENETPFLSYEEMSEKVLKVYVESLEEFCFF